MPCPGLMMPDIDWSTHELSCCELFRDSSEESFDMDEGRSLSQTDRDCNYHVLNLSESVGKNPRPTGSPWRDWISYHPRGKAGHRRNPFAHDRSHAPFIPLSWSQPIEGLTRNCYTPCEIHAENGSTRLAISPATRLHADHIKAGAGVSSS